MNHPPHDQYFAAVHAAGEQLEADLAGLHRQEDAAEISPVSAAARRVFLLERHLAECQRARLEHFGGTP